MPSPQNFNINANGDTTPTGNGAQMSRTGANNQPNQGQWHTAAKQAVIKLPSAVWNVTPNDGNAYAFTVPANSPSPVFTLQVNATLGSQWYDVETAPGVTGGGTRPTVIVNP
jgi:hypothetical protein